MTANNGRVDRRTLLKMMGAAGASAAVISGCGPSSISGQGISGGAFDKSVPLATAGPGGGGKNWKPGYALRFLPPEDMPTSGPSSDALAALSKEKLLELYRLMNSSRKWETTMKDLFLAGERLKGEVGVRAAELRAELSGFAFDRPVGLFTSRLHRFPMNLQDRGCGRGRGGRRHSYTDYAEQQGQVGPPGV